MEPQGTPTPAWKFWHPLPVWQMLAILVVVEVAVTFGFVALHELAGVAVPGFVSGGVAAGIGVTTVMLAANRRRRR